MPVHAVTEGSNCTSHRIADQSVEQTVTLIACVERGAMQDCQLLRRDEACRILMRGLRRGNELEALVRPVVSRGASDDAIEILWIALGFHEGLPSAAGAPNEVRQTGRRAIRRGDSCLALHGRFVYGAIAEIDQFLRMTHGELRGITDVSRIGRRGGVSATQRRGERRVLNRSAPAAIADLLKLAVPSRKRQPDLGLDVRV